MWYRLGQFILKNRLILLILLLGATAVMGYYGSQVKLSYEFTKAIPDDNPRYRDYQAFLQKFGGDGATVVIGIQTDSFFKANFFNQVGELHQSLKRVAGVTDIASIPEAVNLQNDTLNKRLLPYKIFHYPYTGQSTLDSTRQVFENLPFYRRLLYNPATHAYLMGVNVNKDTVNSKSRTRLINDIMQQVHDFEKKTHVSVHTSGLPYIRTIMSNRIKDEMNWFLIGSLLLSAITLILFFRSTPDFPRGQLNPAAYPKIGIAVAVITVTK